MFSKLSRIYRGALSRTSRLLIEVQLRSFQRGRRPLRGPSPECLGSYCHA
jgi:hypothetical protein